MKLIAGFLDVKIEAGKGHNTTIVYRCEAALNVVKYNPPDLVLMDLVVPGLGGEATTKALKRDKKTRRIKILLVSAHHELEERASRCGADGFLS